MLASLQNLKFLKRGAWSRGLMSRSIKAWPFVIGLQHSMRHVVTCCSMLRSSTATESLFPPASLRDRGSPTAAIICMQACHDCHILSYFCHTVWSAFLGSDSFSWSVQHVLAIGQIECNASSLRGRFKLRYPTGWVWLGHLIFLKQNVSVTTWKVDQTMTFTWFSHPCHTVWSAFLGSDSFSWSVLHVLAIGQIECNASSLRGRFKLRYPKSLTKIDPERRQSNCKGPKSMFSGLGGVRVTKIKKKRKQHTD